MNIQPQLKAPFPYFGGKSTVAADVWARFGDVNNYIEPFFGSGAVLLGRPTKPKFETVNDADNFVANFWRAVQAESEAVANWMDWPNNESDLHARHYWLVTEGADRLSKLQGDPLGYDTQVAGWWVWGKNCHIVGGNFCQGNGPWIWKDNEWQQQLNSADNRSKGVSRSMINFGWAISNLKDDGTNRKIILLKELQKRLRNVNVVCGDWQRVVSSETILFCKDGCTGIFLDPPYEGEQDIYNCNNRCSKEVLKWCIENQDNPRLRICLAGYTGKFELPGWAVHKWKSRATGRIVESTVEKTKKEYLWFSPHCLNEKRGLLW